MKGLIPTLLCDFYKVSHREQYPEGTEVVYSTWTPRSGKHSPDIKKVTAFGFQGFVKEFLMEFFDDNFFARSKEDVVSEYTRILKNCLFIQEPHTKHIEDLHDLGYLPLLVKAVDEGTQVPFRVPMLTVENTDPRFFWLTNYFETLASNNLWKPATSASTAKVYRGVLDKFALETTGSVLGVEFQGHDFSMRGMSGVEDAARTGVGHLLSFVGTDTIPAIQYAEQYYGANVEKELIGCSVNATEHSVMCAGGKGDEYETYRRLIEDTYPTGIISIVSDTWDLWHVLTDTIPKLKDSIMARDGGAESLDKVVIRPDSGDPADIICGDPNAKVGSPAFKGVVELLAETFGTTETEQGYKLLDSHIGAIYGDAITIARCTDICERLKAKGFASTNVVYGIGSYTYQFNTRDTLGFAMKSTSVTIDGKQQAIFKDPITDDGTKKSAVGRVEVKRNSLGDLMVFDELDPSVDGEDLLTPLFKDGKLIKETTLAEIKNRLNG
jgi:nicotinamide phosphoribosyltransferase